MSYLKESFIKQHEIDYIKKLERQYKTNMKNYLL